MSDRLWPALPFARIVVLILGMPWIVKVKNWDGSIADVVTVDRVAARSVLEAHRSTKRDAWIVDPEGRRVDDGPDEAAD